MLQPKLFLLVLLFAYSACETDKAAVETTKLEKAVVTTLTQTDKRESRDISSTGNFNTATKDEPFRPMLRVPYAPKSEGQSAIRYVTPHTPTQPQPQYSKNEAAGSIQYAGEQPVYKTIHANAGYHSPPPPAAASYPTAPTSPNYQQVYDEQQQQQHQQYYISPARQPTSDATPPAAPSAQPEQNYIYSSQINNQQDYASQQQQRQQQNYYYRAQPQVPAPPQPTHIQALPQQPVKYLLAVPHSYLQQLQQQYYSPHREQAHFPATHPMIQVIGPLARDHQGVYRPIHQYSEPTTSTAAAPMQKYTIQYLQIPLSRLLAAVAPTPYPNNVQQNSNAYPQYAQAPAAYATPQPQQVQQVYQTKSEPQPHPKPRTKIVQTGPTKAPQQPQPQLQQHATPAPTPIVHYNPAYVQPPPAEQQPILGPLQLTRHSHALHAQAAAPLSPQHPVAQQLPLIRILPANRYFNVMPMQQHVQYAAPQSHISVSFPQHYDPSRSHLSYNPVYSQQPGAVQYYQHGAGVHYGTHLYHPPTPSLAAAKALEQQQNAQQPAPSAAQKQHVQQ